MWLVFFSVPRPPGSPLFPYTTLFRSGRGEGVAAREHPVRDDEVVRVLLAHAGRAGDHELPVPAIRQRSEEHTSELQSPCNLVCRLLLEKKNNVFRQPQMTPKECA